MLRDDLLKGILYHIPTAPGQHAFSCINGGLDGKASACNAGGPRFDPWVGKILWRRKWQPTPVLLPRKPHGWRSVVGYRPWGHKESDSTERLYLISSQSIQ